MSDSSVPNGGRDQFVADAVTRALVDSGVLAATKYRSDFEVVSAWKRDIANDPNPLLRCGNKTYSQFDEDGILFEILRRLGLGSGRFLEIGVGDGTENNTLALLAAGWRGHWVGAQPLAWSPSGRRLTFTQAFVTLDNLANLLPADTCDVCSLDIDGNDYWIGQALLAHIQPRVFVVEYNAKLIPPIRFTLPYEPTMVWTGDDFFGASIMQWHDLFVQHGYRLVCCSYCGVNAFFVRDPGRAFDDVPSDPAAVFRPAMYAPFPVLVGHPTSMRTLAEFERQ
jgi:hypothetical protein